MPASDLRKTLTDGFGLRRRQLLRCIERAAESTRGATSRTCGKTFESLLGRYAQEARIFIGYRLGAVVAIGRRAKSISAVHLSGKIKIRIYLSDRWNTELLVHGKETVSAVITIFGARAKSLLEGLHDSEVLGLAVELIGIADNLLLDRERYEVAVRQGEVICLDVGERQTRARVSLGHKGVARQTVSAEHVRPNCPVADVWLVTKTINVRRIGADYADVMEHGGLEDEIAVRIEFRVTVYNSYGETGHTAAVSHKDVPEPRGGHIVAGDDGLSV